ncbi:hypothetical protein HWV01_02120 [Moritella sp. 5]|uniref:hypothetical protein n=1 Tax=Moritella sp. 5 TaxID=2746231 RepID=UPI001BA664B3|nr:hypothetical protein [Moritella sp. 5]QUM79206.1 hypothetical protein HWV01_02120 [Moritella sp. 5]
MNYTQLKEEIFDFFHTELRAVTFEIQNRDITRNKKATLINNAVESVKNRVGSLLVTRYPQLNRPKLYMLVQYCYTVMSFEYRNTVWPYEYMAFSRRNGELWERFCKAAWDHSEKETLYRIRAPQFDEVKNNFLHNIASYTSTLDQRNRLLADVNEIFELVGEINMVEDEMFNLHERNHIIDFKSGFGSNEKGNTLRLLAVGKAYKHWDRNVELLFLVRQNENNNYLNTIRRSNLWSVFCGDDAYSKIDELTDAGICEVRREAIDFEHDLSPDFWAYLVRENIHGYLNW